MSQTQQEENRKCIIKVDCLCGESHRPLHQSAKLAPQKRKKQLLSCLPKSWTVNKETKCSEVIRQSFFSVHTEAPSTTFDSQPLDLGFVQPSGASLLSTRIGIPSRCSHPRGFGIVFPGQREKNHQSNSHFHTL